MKKRALLHAFLCIFRIRIDKNMILLISEDTGMKKNGRPVTAAKPNDDVLLREYKTMTARQMGEKYGVRDVTVRKWIYDARDRKLAENGQAESLMQIRALLEQLQREMRKIDFSEAEDMPVRMQNEKDYNENMKLLSFAFEALRKDAKMTVSSITDVLKCMNDADWENVWGHIPDGEE